MVKSRALVCLVAIAVVFSGLSFAESAAADRISGDLNSGAKIRLRGNVHGLARPEFDLGRANSGRMMHVVSLSFHPSAAQQNELDLFLEQLGDRTSPSYHKYLTPAQFADRFGMTQNDINKIVAWLQLEGFLNITVSNSRDMVSFDGTVAQVESTFALEMHNYLVNGEVHLANAGEPSVPAGLAGAVLSMAHLHDFSPKPRAKMRPHFTSYISGNHFLSPADFATIYNVDPLYTAGNTGTGQQIVVVGQSTVAATDLANFRSAAGLPAATVTMQSSIVGTGTPTRCGGDEGESDLDLEWSNGVAKNASVTFVFAPVSNGDTCASRQGLNVWDALHAAIVHNVAPFISTSYGFCESNTIGISLSQVQTYQSWAQEGQAQGQTITAASGDSGAADCDNTSPATEGLAVDVPASIPEVTGAGGNEFTGDSPTTTGNNPPGGDPPYWSPALTTSDTISSALEYIPEEAWNDDAASIAANNTFSASGGGASAFFSKPGWQTGNGVPADGKRDVPDISVNASADHDGYLVCSEDDGSGGIAATCTNGFRDAPGGNLDVVGGTSAAAPTFTAILALINQFVGNAPPTGLAPVNPMLYKLAAGSPSAFHDVTAGNNMVPCKTSTPNCTSTTMGFSAGVGYDQVTGLGSPNANALAQAWEADIAEFTVTAGALSPASVAAGSGTTATITVAPLSPNGIAFTGTVTFSCNGLPTGATCTFNPASVDVTSTTTTITTQMTITTTATMAAGTTSVSVKGVSGSSSASAAVSLVITATTETFTLSSQPPTGATLSVAQGQVTGAVNITVQSSSTPSFVISSGSGQQTALAVTYTCSGLPTESNCIFSPGTMNTSTTQSTTLTLTIQTTPPTARLQRPMDRGPRIFYATLLPGLFGIVLTLSVRKRSWGATRILALVIGLGFSTLWMASCGGTSGGGSNSNPGTPTGSFPVTVNATTGGANPITSSLSFTLTVTP